jgi:isocitrate/isopropylmalate dehydrogenase
MAMILAGAALFRYMDDSEAAQISRAIYESVFEAVYDGIRTPDLAGTSSTTDFTNEIIRRIKSKLEVWDALGQ